MKRTLFYTLVFFSSCFSLLAQNAVTNATFVSTGATPLSYSETNPATAVTNTYLWGQANDFRLSTVTFGGQNYFLDNDFTQISYNIVRVDGNGGVTGDRCGFFVLENGGNDFNYQSSFPGTLGDCSMQEVLRDPIVTRGANDVFKNATVTAQNIERIDALYEAFVVPSTASLTQVGFIAPEKNGNSSYRAAPILSVDAVTGEPTSFGPIIEIGGTNAVDGTNDFGAVTQPLDWSFLVNSPTATGNPYRVGGITEVVGISLITLADLGYSVGDTVYGISFFDNNVPFNADLLDVTDPNDFPNANGGGADIHGGLGAIVTSQATVSGHVYNDLNANGFQDASEPNLPNVTITITDALNVVQVVTTDANGDFSAFVAGGNTVINVDENDSDIPSGSVLIEGFGNDGRTYTTVAGQNTFTSNFGFAPDPGPQSPRSCDDDPVFITSANFDANTVVVETEGGTPGAFDVGDVFRFSDVTAGLDCLVSIDAFVNGAGILVLDGEEENIPGFGGFSRAFQPQMDGTPGVNGQEVVFTISYVQADTTIPQAVSVYFTALDLDSETLTDIERVKFETPDVYYTNGANSTLVVDSNPTQLIGMSTDAGIVNGINTDPNYAFTAYYNSFTSIQYTISKDGYDATPGFEDRQFSLLFEDIAYPTEDVDVITNPIICGQVFVDGVAKAGVTVNLSGDDTQTAITDANGQYSFTVPGNGNYTITETDPAGVISLSDVDGANDNTIDISIIGFESSQENDFFDSIVVSVGDVTVTEGNDGTTVVANFPVTLSAPADINTIVTFTVADGSGTLGDADYVAPTVLTATIPAGQTSGLFPVTVNGDDDIEGDEQFTVSISSVSNGTIDPAANTGTGTITNDDAAVVSIGDVVVTEGNDGTNVVASFPVSLSLPVDTDTVVTFVVSEGTGTIGDADYVAPSELTVTIPAGQTTAVFPVTVNGDDKVESDEEFEVTITNTTNGTIDPAATTGTGTITNDDATVVSIDDVTIVEGDAGTVNADFTVSLTNPVDTATTVTFTVTDDSADNAGNSVDGGNDYEVPTTLTVTIPAGETEGTVTVVVNGDETVEADEDFLVTLTATDNGTITTTVGENIGTGTITNDDDTVVSVGPVTVIEGNDGTTVVANFPVTLSAAADTDTVVTFTVTDGSGTIGDADYVAPTELTVTIPAGQTTAVFPVTVNGDDVVESDEEFIVTIVSTTNGSIDSLASTAKGTITNDDDAGVVSVSTEEELEGT
ncbi:Calx-beta domain-containing protein, partial [uncultured Dokdonia sp.]|uniref:beta strand repeat-containing protein n=1 Tax=uncultured Dokdonia sp. TaxID=575653 RepID=UPI0030ECBB36